MADEQTVTGLASLTFHRFTVPGVAHVPAAGGDTIPVAINNLDQTTLDDLVSAWIDDVYRRAGKPNAWQLSP